MTDDILQFLKTYDFSGLAKAYNQSYESWNADNWQTFITEVRQAERTRILKLIESAEIWGSQELKNKIKELE